MTTAPQTRKTRLTAVGVSKSVGPVRLLAPTTVEVAAGSAVVLRGPNGAGKTTLLKILGGVMEPTAGSALLDGETVDERRPGTREAVAALLGAPTAYRDLTLADHLTLVDATWGGDLDTCDDRVDAMLERLEIAHLDDRFPHELSSGQGQLFRLALTLFRPSTVLLLDEPEQRLDVDKRLLIARLLVERKQAGTAVVMACHDPVMIGTVADQIVDLVEADGPDGAAFPGRPA